MKFLLLGFLAALCVFHTSEGMTIDQRIISASKVSNLDYLTDLNSGTVMQELDMVLTLDQWRALQGDKRRKKRKAIKDTRYRWTNKLIPFKKARDVFNKNDWDEVEKAMNEWSEYTCIRFTNATEQHKNFVYFDDASGCYSYVGMTGGSQTIGLAGGCRHKGIIVHEIGHAVGFHHEQNRPDRDNYVTIRRENIPEGIYYNFKKYDSDAVETFGVPYDYGSVMHYGGRAFSRNGQLTIQTHNSADQSKIGKREGLSFFDIKLANLMYSCHNGCSKDIQCPGHGFVGKDCRCYCPGDPVQECDAVTGTGGATEPTTKRPEVTEPPCENLNRNCDAWAEAGHCPTSQYMQLYCKQSCNLCTATVTTTTTQSPCTDERGEHDCQYWRGEGFCVGRYEQFMEKNCQKSCGHCSATSVSAGREGSDGENGSANVAASGVWVCLSSLAMLVVTFRRTVVL